MAFATLSVDFVAKIASLEESMDRAGKSVASLENRFVSMGRTVSGALAGLGVGIGVGGLAAIAKSGIDAADSLNDMSQRLDVSVKALASFKLAADQSGTSLDSDGAGIARLSNSIGEAEGGNKQLAQALQSLGITARDPKEAFFQLADAVQKTDAPNKRAALLSQMLGKSYGELVPLLSQGSNALRESAKQSESFAEAMSRLAPDADKFNDQLATLKINAAGAAAEGLVPLVKELNEVFDRIKLVKDLIDAGGLSNAITITAGTSEISTVMRRLKDDIKETQAAIEGEKAKGKYASPFEEKLRGLNAQLEILKKSSRDAALALGEQFKNYKVPQIPGVRGRIDLSAASRGKNIDTESMSADDIANAWKQADDELKQYADDRAFVSKFDMQRDNAINAIAQEWKDAGEALKQDMLTPLEKFNNRLEYINELWQRGVIDIETYSRATEKAFDDANFKVAELDTFAKTAAENIQNSFADFLFNPFDKGVKGMAQSFGETIQRMIANAVAADLTKRLFGDLVQGGSGSGLAGGLLKSVGSLLSFAGGGYTGDGSRSGGIDGKGGFLSVIHPRETIVDHTRGQSVGGGLVVHQNIVVNGGNTQAMKRAAGQGLRDAYGVMRSAERYV